MTKRILALFAVALLLGADKPGDAGKEVLKKLQGEWKVEKAVRGGKDAPAEVSEKMVLKFDGGTVSVGEAGNAREEKAEFSINPGKNPAEIDIRPGRDATKELVKGIYKLDGDTLTMCWAKSGDRPTEFASKEGTQQMLFVLKRAKK